MEAGRRTQSVQVGKRKLAVAVGSRPRVVVGQHIALGRSKCTLAVALGRTCRTIRLTKSVMEEGE